jgi:hypothetical protein
VIDCTGTVLLDMFVVPTTSSEPATVGRVKGSDAWVAALVNTAPDWRTVGGATGEVSSMLPSARIGSK